MGAPFRIAPLPEGSATEVSDEAGSEVHPTTTGPLGILKRLTGRGSNAKMLVKTQPTAPPRKAGGRKPPPPTPMQGYMDRLTKLVPAEVIGLYLFGVGGIPPSGKPVMVGWAIFCLACVFAVRVWGTQDNASGAKTEWAAVAIACVSFVIWIYVMPGPFTAYDITVPYIGSLLIAGWTFVVPLFYRPTKP